MNNPEQSANYPERFGNLAHLKRFDSDLACIEQRDMIRQSLTDYVKQEFDLDDSEASTVCQLIDATVCPEDMAADSPIGYIQCYRIAIFTHIQPLYRSLKSAEEYSAWLPRALTATLRQTGGMAGHDVHDCTISGIPASDNCKYGRCPVKVVRNQVTDYVYSDTFNDFDHQADPNDTALKTYALINEIEKRQIINESDAFFMRDCYGRNYTAIFSKS